MPPTVWPFWPELPHYLFKIIKRARYLFKVRCVGKQHLLLHSILFRSIINRAVLVHIIPTMPANCCVVVVSAIGYAVLIKRQRLHLSILKIHYRGVGTVTMNPTSRKSIRLERSLCKHAAVFVEAAQAYMRRVKCVKACFVMKSLHILWFEPSLHRCCVHGGNRSSYIFLRVWRTI